MAEIWVAAAITVGGGIIAGVGQEKKDKNDKKYNKEMTEEDYRRTAQQSGYEAALENYYNERARYEKQRGLDQYRQFSTMKNYAPNVDDQSGRVAAPTMPQYNEFAPTTPTAPGANGGGDNKGILSKVDPLGSKLINFDPIGKKLFGGLF